MKEQDIVEKLESYNQVILLLYKKKWCLQIISLLLGKLELRRVCILSNAPVVNSYWRPAGVNLLRVHTIFRVKVLHLTVGEDTVELILDFELGPQSGAQGKALLLPCELQ